MSKAIINIITIVLLYFFAGLCLGDFDKQQLRPNNLIIPSRNISWPTQYLPNSRRFIFSMYGVPKSVSELKQLVGTMKIHSLGNGFDHGPTARRSSYPQFKYLSALGWPVIAYPGCSDFQVMGGPCKYHDTIGIKLLRDGHVPVAIHFGEWGSYFHDLSGDKYWWKTTYGDEFSKYMNLMRPKELKGYSTFPSSRRQCYNELKEYFEERSKALGAPLLSLTGHSHYEAYAAEWGAQIVGIELGVPAFSQSKIAFARGASRHWQRPWTIEVSSWLYSSATRAGQLRRSNGHTFGFDAGHSLSFYKRMWLHGWFAGAAMVTPGASIKYFFTDEQGKWTLSKFGQNASQMFKFISDHERGTPYTPIALIIDHLAGYNPYEGHPWGILDNTPSDTEIYHVLEQLIFPGSNNIRKHRNPNNAENNYLVSTPYGEIFDVQLSNIPKNVLIKYPVAIMLGDINFDKDFLDVIQYTLERNNVVILPRGQVKKLTHATINRMKKTGNLIIIDKISKNLLSTLSATYLPIEVKGDPIQYQINFTHRGWVIELINNHGVIKQPDSPEIIDKVRSAHVKLVQKFQSAHSIDWETNHELGKKELRDVIIPPGEVRYIEFITNTNASPN